MTLTEKLDRIKQIYTELDQLEEEVQVEILQLIDIRSEDAKDQLKTMIPYESFVKDLILHKINLYQRANSPT